MRQSGSMRLPEILYNYWLLVVYGITNLGIKVALSVLISKKQITKINYENK